jgi:hypothetical protein
MRIATWGSCLSRYTARAYVNLFGGDILGSVYHNRIDRFVNTYIYGTEREPDQDLFARLSLTPNGEHRARVMFGNQRADGQLGKHGGASPGFMEAIKSPLDLIIMDNFVDLTARLYKPKFGGAAVFLNGQDVEDVSSIYELEAERIPIGEALKYWRIMIDWVRNQQPGTKIFFINFPFDHHQNPEIVNRSQEFSDRMTSTRIKIVPKIPIAKSLIQNSAHFHNQQYAMYAGYIGLLANAKRGKTLVDDGADNVLWGTAPSP